MTMKNTQDALGRAQLDEAMMSGLVVRNALMSRRGFVAASAVALAGFALAGCESGAQQEPPAESQDGSEQPSQEPQAQAEAEPAPAEEPAPETDEAAAGKVLVACFSATGNTRAIAEQLAAHLGADRIEIEPAEPYTEDDLNYNDETTRATVEQNDPATRPGLATMPDFSGYDTVLLGHPIWWGKVPRLMCTLLEGSDLSGKKVAEFCTSGSSGIEGAAPEFQSLAPNAIWIGEQRFEAGASDDEVAAWADSLGIA